MPNTRAVERDENVRPKKECKVVTFLFLKNSEDETGDILRVTILVFYRTDISSRWGASFLLLFVFILYTKLHKRFVFVTLGL